MPEELKEPDFPLLEALAKITVRDFRLGDFMRQLGMNPNQPVIFYRKLIREAKEFKELIDTFEQNIDSDYKIKRQLRADLSVNEERVRTLAAKLHNLEGQTHQKTESLEKERQGLVATSSELQAKVSGYEALTELLRGESKPQTLKLMSDLYWDMYTAALNAISYKRPPPDPGRLDKLRQSLSQNLKNILRIPPEELELELDKLRAENVELRNTNTALALSYGALRQRGWVDTSPGETMSGGD